MISIIYIKTREYLILCKICWHVINAWKWVSVCFSVLVNGLRTSYAYTFLVGKSRVIYNYNLCAPWKWTRLNNIFFNEASDLF